MGGEYLKNNEFWNGGVIELLMLKSSDLWGFKMQAKLEYILKSEGDFSNRHMLRSCLCEKIEE